MPDKNTHKQHGITMKNNLRQGIFPGLALALVCSFGSQAQSFPQQQEKLVVIEPLSFSYEQNKLEAVGTAEAIKSITLFPAAADEVTEVNFVPGQKVYKGEVLLKLDDRRQRVAVTRAKLQLEDAERSLQRLIDSQSRGAVAQSELDLARTTRDLAKVTLDEAMADLEDRRIVAPFTGVVGLTDVEVGDRITTDTAVTSLDDRSQLFIKFRAPESSLKVLLNSPDVSLQPWGEREKKLPASIAQLDSRINETDRTLSAKAVLKNDKDMYRPGMSFRVNVSVNGERFAAIPEYALQWSATGAYVWTVVDGKAKRIEVEVRQRLRGTVLVSGELQENDQLITEGIQRLRNGQTVTTELAMENGHE